MELKGKIVLVTGGASGIGKIMGRKALEKGCEMLIVWDINEESMHKMTEEFAMYRNRMRFFAVDISKVEMIEATASLFMEEFGRVDVLINNAGIVVGKNFVDHSGPEISRTLLINTEAAMQITRVFLPTMISRNSGAICNIASSAGLVSNPKMSVYAASKWAIVGWSDSLWLELKALKKSISVTTVMPFYINTGMFDGVKSLIIPILDPEKASSKIIASIEADKRMLAMPLPYWFIRISQGLLPLKVYDFIMGKLLGVYSSMDDFRGRKK